MFRILKYVALFAAAGYAIKYAAENKDRIVTLKDRIVSPDAVKATAESAEPGK